MLFRSNASFAHRYLADEGIKVVGGDTGGTSPRRIQYWPLTGRARQLAVRADTRKLMEVEITTARAPTAAPASADVELF